MTDFNNNLFLEIWEDLMNGTDIGGGVFWGGMLPMVGLMAGISTVIAIAIISCILVWVMVDKSVSAWDKGKHWIRQIVLSWFFINISGDILFLMLALADIKY